MLNLPSICSDVRTLTNQVGKYILLERKSFSEDKVEVKSKNSLVSHVDKTAEKMLVDQLSKLIPAAGFITEEETNNVRKEKYNWIIDPLDGTTNFIHGIPCFCISIALMEKDEIILGVVHELNLDECFYAWKNGGAFMNDQAIHCSLTDDLKNALIATGFPYYDYQYLDQYLETFKILMNETRGLRRLGSAAVDLAYVACGRFEAFYEYSLNSWDVAAGAIIVKEAGGKVSDFSGKENYLFGKEIIACNAPLYKNFYEVIKRYFD